MTRRAVCSIVLSIAGLYLVGGISLSIGDSTFAGGPNPGLTGALGIGGKSAEPTCRGCHNVDADGNPSDNLNHPGGAVTILDLPDQYAPGVTYPLRVRLASIETADLAERRWGFQITAVRAVDGEGTGTFILPAGDSLQIRTGFGQFQSRRYVEHTFEATKPGIGSPVEWAFEWTAPDPAVGKIYFFCSGNAASGNLGNDGDWIYTGRDSMTDPAVAVARRSWGGLKSLFR